ncbi:MAG TPA: DUF4230 domain-containing protein [Acidimicrobiales bacterium]|nr:DUF4230 domain-containing protein [Acidimicrobiales bacterium]
MQTTQPKVRVARGGGLTLLLAAVGLAAIFLLAGRMFGFLDFGSTTIDRSQPPVLVRLTDLAEYHAATANFEVIIDLEKDVKLLPDFLAGQRALMVAAGTVDAQVDFSKLKDENIEISPDKRHVRITLPAPELSDVVLDQERTYVSSRSRGLFDRIGGVFTGNPTDDQPLYEAAQEKLRIAAENTELRSLAATNTRSMLEQLLKSLGFETVEIVFVTPPAP